MALLLFLFFLRILASFCTTNTTTTLAPQIPTLIGMLHHKPIPAAIVHAMGVDSMEDDVGRRHLFAANAAEFNFVKGVAENDDPDAFACEARRAGENLCEPEEVRCAP